MDVQQRSDCYRSYSRMETVERWEKDIWDFWECKTSEISGFFAVRLKLEQRGDRQKDPSAAERFVEYHLLRFNEFLKSVFPARTFLPNFLDKKLPFTSIAMYEYLINSIIRYFHE